jgi:hypothetical protein
MIVKRCAAVGLGAALLLTSCTATVRTPSAGVRVDPTPDCSQRCNFWGRRRTVCR